MNDGLKSIESCDDAYAEISRALYGRPMTDVNGIELVRVTNANRFVADDRLLRTALGFAFATSETAMFHFRVEGVKGYTFDRQVSRMNNPPVHHFAVIPWHDVSTLHGRAYTVFMAYANTYTLSKYIDRAAGLAQPYKDVWTMDELLIMLRRLCTSEGAWSDYFKNGLRSQVNKMICYKYESVQLEKAFARLA